MVLALWGILTIRGVNAAPAPPINTDTVTFWQRLHPEFPKLLSRTQLKPRIEYIGGLAVNYYPSNYAQEMNGRTLESFELNISTFRVINSNRNSWLDLFFSLVIYLGKAGWLVLVAALFWFYRRNMLIVLLGSQAAGAIVVHLLKNTCSQPRPGVLLPNITLMEKVYIGSFPSADVCFAVALAVVLISIAKTWWQKLLCVVYPLLIMYERVYVGAHFPLDVCAGALIGLLATLAIQRLYRSRPPSESEKIANQLS